ncbi:hypothetical protein [Sorangium sp. So ce1389]|uniref:hypothetical protein n=1 Tax=Sorangium sp. So ce1389 TaxID=3133336 RepID=UPI003F61167A
MPENAPHGSQLELSNQPSAVNTESVRGTATMGSSDGSTLSSASVVESSPVVEPMLPLRPDRRIVAPSDNGGTERDTGERQQEFFIPVHGEVWLRPIEVSIVDHPAFQRLGEIFQLGQTYLVYRGATHKRLEHAMGALHVAQLMMNALERNSGPKIPRPQDTAGAWNLGEKLRPEEVAFTRLGALLHDVGHLPAGHTLEDELGLLHPHDGDERLNLVLDRTSWYGGTHSPTLRELIDQQYAKFAKMTGLCVENTKVPLSASQILGLLISKDQAHYKVSDDCAFRLNVCRDIIGNTICADLLDYLHRDWLHLGKRREFDTRLLGYMEIRTRKGAPSDTRLVINLRGANRLRTDAVTAILDLLESRYQLAEIALFHRTKVCAAAMLERLVAELAHAYGDGGESFLRSLPENLLERSDSGMLAFLDDLLNSDELRRDGEERSGRIAGAHRLVRQLRSRQLYKEFIAYHEYRLADAALDVQNRYAGPAAEKDHLKRAQVGAANRLAAVRLLETDFGMAPCSLVMYCPPRKMNTKIAEVQVLIHGDVHTLDSFEREHGDHGVTGGHLRAQKERFRRLWRVVFGIASDERDRLQALDLIEPLGRAISLCVLGIQPAAGTIEHSVRSLARELTSRRGSPLHGGTVLEHEEMGIAARERPVVYYPSSAPSLLTCIKR